MRGPGKRSVRVVAALLAWHGGASSAGELNPQKGNSQSQVLDLTRRFDLATWNSDADLDLARFAYLNTPRFFPHAVIRRAGPVADLVPRNCHYMALIIPEARLIGLAIRRRTAIRLDRPAKVGRSKTTERSSDLR